MIGIKIEEIPTNEKKNAVGHSEDVVGIDDRSRRQAQVKDNIIRHYPPHTRRKMNDKGNGSEDAEKAEQVSVPAALNDVSIKSLKNRGKNLKTRERKKNLEI